MADDQNSKEPTIRTYAPEKQTFPLKPKTWDYVKEAFQPTEVRAQIDAIRKRKNGDS